MEFEDYPRRFPAHLYEEAANTYASLVSRRVHAVYRTGRVSVPGISDLDLIIVPIGPRYDNFAHFSLRRLPDHLLPAFRHNPFVVPLEHREVMRYSSHNGPRLIHGRDVLTPSRYERSAEDSWSTLLEDYCHYQHFVGNARVTNRVAVRFLLSKLNSIRLPISALEMLTGSAGADPETDAGLRRGLELRATWFDGAESPASRAVDGWELMNFIFDRFECGLRTALDLAPDADLRAFAHAFLSGEPVIPGLDPGRVRKRQEEVRQYLLRVSALTISSQPVVADTMFRKQTLESCDRHMPPRAVRAAVRLKYMVDGRLRTLLKPVVPTPPGVSTVSGAATDTREGRRRMLVCPPWVSTVEEADALIARYASRLERAKDEHERRAYRLAIEEVQERRELLVLLRETSSRPVVAASTSRTPSSST